LTPVSDNPVYQDLPVHFGSALGTLEQTARHRQYFPMELLGMALSIPVAFVASSLYFILLVKIVSKSDRLSRALRIASYIVLTLFAIELLLLLTFGSVRSRAFLGPGFFVAHILIFFAGTPAFANILVLRSKRGVFANWYVVAVLCTLFAFCLVLLQYTVSESLYGIDGDDGPYSEQLLKNTGKLSSGGYDIRFLNVVRHRDKGAAKS
jgi:hypothetical protein